MSIFGDPIRLVILLAAVSVVIGTALHGIEIQRMLQNVAARPEAALAFRFILQPTVSTILAIRDGIKDARAGAPPYFWSILSDPDQRWSRLNEGLRATSKIILIALLIDLVYQAIELRAFYPSEALITAILLGLIPYLLVRGPAERVARWWMQKQSEPSR